MSEQNTYFQSDTICTFGFMACQRWPLQILTQWAKTPFLPTSLSQNSNILRRLCQINLKEATGVGHDDQ